MLHCAAKILVRPQLLKQVILIRHATTDLAGTLCGHLDPPLNDAGRKQTAALVASLKNLRVDRLYASDLLRSVQTAEALAYSRGISILEKQNLREISFGAWEGMRWADLQTQISAAPLGVESSPEICPPQGETFNCFCRRVKSSLDEIASEFPEETTAIVTHLGAIRIAFTELAGIDPASDLLGEIGYGSAHHFEASPEAWCFVRRL